MREKITHLSSITKKKRLDNLFPSPLASSPARNSGGGATHPFPPFSSLSDADPARCRATSSPSGADLLLPECCKKLSPECSKHLARNTGFPTRAAVQALASQHTMLKSLLCGGGGGGGDPDEHRKPVSTAKHRAGGENDLVAGSGQVVLYARRLDLSLESQNLRSLLDGMHWRVMELEKVCSRMKTQMSKMKAARRATGGGGGGAAGRRAASRSLPRMCS